MTELADEVERIVKPAVRVGDVVFSLVERGGHHYQLYEALGQMGLVDETGHGVGRPVTGYLTTAARFVDVEGANAIRRHRPPRFQG